MLKNECEKCGLSKKDPLYWEVHQMMADGNLWCIVRK